MMARGDPLNNPTILERYPEFYDLLALKVEAAGLKLQVNLSTIFPKARLAKYKKSQDEGKHGYNLVEAVFKGKPVSLYASLYALDPKTRRRHLPGAADVEDILATLASLDPALGQRVAIHGAVVKGINADPTDQDNLAARVAEYRLSGKVNVVRFNPHPRSTLVEADDAVRDRFLQKISSALEQAIGSSKHVARVARRVFGSCGCFVLDPTVGTSATVDQELY